MLARQAKISKAHDGRRLQDLDRRRVAAGSPPHLHDRKAPECAGSKNTLESHQPIDSGPPCSDQGCNVQGGQLTLTRMQFGHSCLGQSQMTLLQGTSTHFAASRAKLCICWLMLPPSAAIPVQAGHEILQVSSQLVQASQQDMWTGLQEPYLCVSSCKS